MFYQPFFVGNLRKRLSGARFECHRNVALKRCFFFTIKSVESQRGLSAATLQHLKPEVVLSEGNRKSFIEKFKPRQIEKVSDEKVSRAAVLVPLCKHEGELGFLYTLRSTRMSTNRGQVSFPGGMYDKEDCHLEETALRETWEELKIPREKVDVWTCGSIIHKKDLKVMPVFGYIGEVDPNKLNINRDEVEEAFFLSLKNLCDPSLFRFTQFRDNYILPVYLGGKHRVWGFTAAITHRVLNILVPNAYKHKLVYVQPVLPQIKKLEKNIPPS
ncbi:mitochondrial coenzyme A diphosphatase NUDT8 isoform X2 [Andrena cerasifolii]|uniref:mitochondrial coenzyme A diphosphatase NUDT8 isoform X2 n=1 Tax=Andrena cerasifolii TaxID=2819439 RepID=UPI004037B15F